MKKKFKFGFFLMLIAGLLTSSSAFAASDYENELEPIKNNSVILQEPNLESIYGPENGSVTFQEPNISEITPLSAYGRIIYQADFDVNTNYQIPRDIKIPSSTYDSIRINSNAAPKNSSTKEYQVVLESFSSWQGGYTSEQTVTIPVNVNRYEYFYNLSTSKEYRLRIVGAVTGNITVYEQTR